jgi:cyanate permease
VATATISVAMTVLAMVVAVATVIWWPQGLAAAAVNRHRSHHRRGHAMTDTGPPVSAPSRAADGWE